MAIVVDCKLAEGAERLEMIVLQLLESHDYRVKGGRFIRWQQHRYG